MCVCVCAVSFSSSGFLCCNLVEAQHRPVQIMLMEVWWSSDGNHTTVYQQCFLIQLLPVYCQRIVVHDVLWCLMILCSPCHDRNCAPTRIYPYIIDCPIVHAPATASTPCGKAATDTRKAKKVLTHLGCADLCWASGIDMYGQSRVSRGARAKFKCWLVWPITLALGRAFFGTMAVQRRVSEQTGVERSIDASARHHFYTLWTPTSNGCAWSFPVQCQLHLYFQATCRCMSVFWGRARHGIQ